MSLRINRPLYGILEVGNYWFLIYYKYHINKLGLTTSTYNPCLLYYKEVVVGLQTDDSLIIATPDFMEIKEDEIQKVGFLCKPIEELRPGYPLEFNGFKISTMDISILIS